MRAFIEDGVRGNIETALEFYNSAIEVLEWGSERWKDVPFEEKGAIFQPTFIRGVKCLRLDVLLKVNSMRSNYNACTDIRRNGKRLVNRILANSLARSWLRKPMIFSRNLPTFRRSQIYLTLDSSCRSSITLRDKHTREL